MASPDVNLVEEWVEWANGTRTEAVSPYRYIEKTVNDPVITSAPVPLAYFARKAHVVDFICYLDGVSSPQITMNIRWGSDIVGAGTDLIAAGTTLTSTVPVSKEVQQGTIPANSILWAEISDTSGVLRTLTLIVKYRTKV